MGTVSTLKPATPATSRFLYRAIAEYNLDGVLAFGADLLLWYLAMRAVNRMQNHVGSRIWAYYSATVRPRLLNGLS
jgi:hypothetical protein